MGTITMTGSGSQFGTDGNETILGSTGNDTIVGLGGDDLLDGGAGDDVFNGTRSYGTYVTSGKKTILGGAGNDVILDSDGNDSIDGGSDNDTIISAKGNDTIFGGSGNDSINGLKSGAGFSTFTSVGNKTINGEGGDDFLLGGSGADTIDGGVGNDTLYGLGGNDSLSGGDGADVIYDQGSSSGNNTLRGGAGSDVLSVYTSNGANLLDGGDGDDMIDGGAGADTILGGLGNDSIRADAGNDVLDGGDGADALDGGAGNDSVTGGADNDVLYDQEGGNDTLVGGDGDDRLDTYSSTGSDSLVGGAGNDTVIGGSGNDTLMGDAGNDSVRGDAGNDVLDGGDGADSLYGGTGNDSLTGGAGNDVIYDQDGGNDTLLGGDGDDRLDTYSGSGSDSLVGGAGNDTLIGGSGNDTLDGGAGINRLSGGDGNDVYIISSRDTHIVDTGGVDSATVSVDFYKVPSTIENVTYSQGVKPLPYWVSSLLPDEASGNYFEDLIFLDSASGKKTVYYYFPTSLPAYDTSADHGFGFSEFTEAQKTFVRSALTYISSVIDLTFVESSDPPIVTTRFTIGFANNNQTGSAGYALYPSDPTDSSLGSPLGGDFFLANQASGAPTPLVDDTYPALTLIHELGHSLGLKHPGEYNAGGGAPPPGPYLNSSEDTSVWTVMSYTSNPAQYHASLRDLDIAALQYLYGPNASSSSAANTYSIDESKTNFIWDGGGIDLVDASSVSKAATIYLAAGSQGFVGTSASQEITSAGQITINFGSVIENLKGTQFNDALYGNDVANSIEGGLGNDSVAGGAGNDTLSGGSGDDSLVGGLGNDVFKPGAGSDTIDGGQQMRQPWITSTAGDYDTLEYEGSPGGITVDLTARTVTVANEVGTDTYSGIEELHGVYNVKDTVTGRTSTSASVGDGNSMWISLAGGSDVVNMTPYGYQQPWAGGVTVSYRFSATPISVVYTSGNTASVTYAASGTQLAGTDILTNVGSIGDSTYNDTFDLRMLTTNQLGYITDPKNGVSYNTVVIRQGGSDTILGNGQTELNFSTVNSTTNGLGLNIDLKLGTADASNLRNNTTVALGTETFSGVRGVVGTYLNDTLLGGVNDDFETFRGEGGNDVIDGRTGYDRADYRSSTSSVTVNLAAGTASSTSQGTDTLRSIEDIRGTMFDDVLDARGFTGGTTSTTSNVGSFWTGLNRFLPEGGNDIIYGNGATGISYEVAMVGVRVDLKAGVADARVESDKLTDGYKTVGRDTFTGVYDVRGTALDDELIGGGAGRITTGTAVEVFRGSAGNDTIDGAGGFDVADYANSPNAINVNLALSSGQVQDGWGFVDTLKNVEQVSASFYADTLVGGAANDWFEGRGGADSIDGGGGSNTVSYFNDTAGVTVKLGGWVGSGAQPSGYAGSALDGTGAIDVFKNIQGALGSNYADTITGDANDNRLDGRGGNDTLDGGAGNDWAYYTQAMQGVRVDLSQGKAFDDGQGVGDAPQTDAAEVDTLISIENVLGGQGNDSIVGGTGANELQGGAGNDTLDGGVGNDTLDGGDGDDNAAFSGVFADYSVTEIVGGYLIVDRVGGRDGSDSVRGVELFVFSDTTRTPSQVIVSTPTIAITSSQSSLTVGQAATLTFTFSESVSDFEFEDITVSGGTLSNLSQSGTIYTATFTPTVNSTASGVVSVASNTFSNAAGNFNVDGSDENNTVTLAVNTVPNVPLSVIASERSKSVTTVVLSDALLGPTPKFALSGADASLFKVSNKGVLSFTTFRDFEQPGDADQDNVYEVSVAMTNAKTGYRVFKDFSVEVELTPILGTSANDNLRGTVRYDTLDGLEGNDKLTGHQGLDTFFVTSGRDSITDFNWLTKGESGSEILKVSAGATADATLLSPWVATGDSINEGTANLITKGMAVDLSGITDGLGWSVTNKGAAITITGSQFDDSLYGGARSDTLDGGEGDDLLSGGKGADSLTGGGGSDIFRLSGENKTDRITDFVSGEDHIQLDHLIFKKLVIGELSEDQFVVGAKALTKTQRVVYDDQEGALYYDADGSGRGAAILIGVLENKPDLVFGDLTVI